MNEIADLQAARNRIKCVICASKKVEKFPLDTKVVDVYALHVPTVTFEIFNKTVPKTFHAQE